MQPLFRRLVLAASCTFCAWATEAYGQFGGSSTGYYPYPSYVARQIATPTNGDLPFVVMPPQQKRDFEAGVAALSQPVRGEFVEAPLTDVVKRLERESGCPIAIDEKALADAAIGTDTLITLNLRVAPLRTVLDGVLRPHALGWAPMSPGLMITTQEQIDTNPDFRPTVLYPVYDLVVARTARGLEYDFDSLVDAITSTVHVNAWRESGTGEGGIGAVPSTASLMVSQPWEIHEEIFSLLQGMRTLKTQQRLGPLEVVRPLSSPLSDDEEPERYLYRPQMRRRQRTYVGLDGQSAPPDNPAPRPVTSGSSGGVF